MSPENRRGIKEMSSAYFLFSGIAIVQFILLHHVTSPLPASYLSLIHNCTPAPHIPTARASRFRQLSHTQSLILIIWGLYDKPLPCPLPIRKCRDSL